MADVAFGPGGAFAYRPGELLVRRGERARARRALDRMGRRPETSRAVGPQARGAPDGSRRFEAFSGLRDALDTRDRLAREGVAAQLNHVLFATSCCDPCADGCPPHPSDEGADDFYRAHPFYAKPFYAKPFYAKPFYAKPFYAKPFYAKVAQNPGVVPPQGLPRSSAQPVVPEPLMPPGTNGMRVAILDTGYAGGKFVPAAKLKLTGTTATSDRPDSNGDCYLDPVAGHGTFIAGVVEQRAPGCRYDLRQVISAKGEADEVQISDALQDLADLAPAQRPHFVNMSFAGYAPLGMDLLAEAVAELQALEVVIVASAGNEATCAATYPAALPGVIGVAALDGEPAPTIEDARAAEFTNYGPWVSAAAPGVDVESLFFNGFQDAGAGLFEGARWSGTSFAAPRVVGALAARADAIFAKGGMTRFEAAQQAVDEMIYAGNVIRKPMLGAIVL